MNQKQAIQKLGEILQRKIRQDEIDLCGGADCAVAECSICAVRDCPHNEPFHYHHDGCPACHLDPDMDAIAPPIDYFGGDES